MEDKKIVDLYWKRSETAISETANQYGRYCHRIAYNGWTAAANRYEEFIRHHSHLRILFLELGVGENTPAIIKYPFWQMTAKNKQAIYACVNFGKVICPWEIAGQSICIQEDIGKVIASLLL